MILRYSNPSFTQKYRKREVCFTKKTQKMIKGLVLHPYFALICCIMRGIADKMNGSGGQGHYVNGIRWRDIAKDEKLKTAI